ncbi:MAG: ABC transporter permease [Acidobacteriaceae bacterium]|nr:ABC transporter permease [Acidobacteriaceae bacterium]
MKRVLAQANKEWMLFRRDKLLIMLSVLMPLVLMLLYGFSQSLRLRNIRLLVYDYDNTPLSRTYLEGYGAALDFVITPRAPSESPERALINGRGQAALIIPQNFQRDALRGTGPTVQLMIDATDSNAATALGNIAQALNSSFGQSSAIGRPTPNLVNLDQRLWFNPGLSNPVFFGTGALGMVLVLFPALLGALATAREYELGTIIQAYASSLTGAQWVLGKSLLYVIIGLVELVICFVLGMAVFSYRIPTNPAVLLVATVLYLFAGVLYGIVLGNATGNQSSAIQGVQLGAFLLSLLLSGFLFPVRNIPLGIRWICYILPATHYVKIVRNSLLRNTGWITSFRPIIALLILSTFFFLWSVIQMRKMQFKD